MYVKVRRKRSKHLLKLFTHYYEREFRRSFKTEWKSEKYNFLEIRKDSIRFIYNLQNDSFYWQTKKSLGKHSLACPIIEMCYHSIESPMYSSIFEMPEKINYNFFFLNYPALKRILFENSGVIGYERFSDREQKWYLECENIFEKNQYFKHAQTLNAQREIPQYKMPPVIPICRNINLNQIRYIAAKWDGKKRMMSFQSRNSELNLALSGNQYCIETFGQRGGIIVDVCNSNLIVSDRVNHLIYLRNNFKTVLLKEFNIIVQYFHRMEITTTPEFLKTETGCDFPCDGLIYVTSKLILKFKPACLNTVDLLSVDTEFLRDRDGFSYKYLKFLYNDKKSLKANRIYEVILHDNEAIIIKRRKDKIYPNSRKIILSQ